MPPKCRTATTPLACPVIQRRRFVDSVASLEVLVLKISFSLSNAHIRLSFGYRALNIRGGSDGGQKDSCHVVALNLPDSAMLVSQILANGSRMPTANSV